MKDIDAALADWARKCEQRATRCDQDADRYAHGNGRADTKTADQKRAEAKVWRDRAEAGKRGVMLVDRKDFRFQLDHKELLTRAVREGRVEYATAPKTSVAKAATAVADAGADDFYDDMDELLGEGEA